MMPGTTGRKVPHDWRVEFFVLHFVLSLLDDLEGLTYLDLARVFSELCDFLVGLPVERM